MADTGTKISPAKNGWLEFSHTNSFKIGFVGREMYRELKGANILFLHGYELPPDWPAPVASQLDTVTRANSEHDAKMHNLLLFSKKRGTCCIHNAKVSDLFLTSILLERSKKVYIPFEPKLERQ